MLTVAGDGLSASNCGNSRETSRFATFASSVAYLRSTCRPSLYDEHDVWLNGSDVDNMPTSILEAYACGLAVASTNPGGIPYIVEDGRTGRLVQCGDAEALAEAALAVIESPPLFGDLTRNALAECVKYTWKSVQPSWMRLYSELAPSDTLLL